MVRRDALSLAIIEQPAAYHTDDPAAESSEWKTSQLHRAAAIPVDAKPSCRTLRHCHG